MPNAYNVAMLATLLLSAVGFGVVFAYTRSLIPSIIAHAILNVPMRPIWASLVIALLLIGACLTARRAAAIARQVFSNSRIIVMIALGVIGGAFAIAAPRVPAVAFAAVAMLLVAVAMEARERRAARLPMQAAA
jgi:type IV secretory pathway TraG/TraD family ATPase VirD4